MHRSLDIAFRGGFVYRRAWLCTFHCQYGQCGTLHDARDPEQTDTFVVTATITITNTTTKCKHADDEYAVRPGRGADR